jgi:hypothetical protein
MSKSEAVKASDTLQPWQLFTLAGLIGATIVVFLSRGQSAAGVIMLSLLVFAAAAVGSAALRALLPLTQKAPVDEPQVLGGRTRAALEREKTLLLRSIKELEFDRAMRKVSEKDFAEMSSRLRARAARLMRQLDAGSLYRSEIEQEIERRLGGIDSGGPASPDAVARRHPSDTSGAPLPEARGDSSREMDAPSPESAERAPLANDATASGPAAAICPSCSTRNDPDARFCKECGVRLGAAS